MVTPAGELFSLHFCYNDSCPGACAERFEIMPDFQLEIRAMEKGFRSVAGLDEAGRGALFGPVAAAAVIFPAEMITNPVSGWLEDIKDSKLLSPRRRKSLCRDIIRRASSVGWGLVSHTEIDRENIHWASMEAMRRSLQRLPQSPDFLLVDGFKLDKVNYAQERVVQGDKRSITIAAASIVAKVLRDEIITHLDSVFEGYALAKNKGYGTREHYRALQSLGPSVWHRMTFNLRDSNGS